MCVIVSHCVLCVHRLNRRSRVAASVFFSFAPEKGGSLTSGGEVSMAGAGYVMCRRQPLLLLFLGN